MEIKDLTLKQKINQMFICGYEGLNYTANKYFISMLSNGLGGVIFFSHNIDSENQFKETINNLKNSSSLPLFLSIDQEGGRVERTEKIHKGKKYLSAKFAYDMGLSYLQDQTKQIALELKNYGINMNFAPVLDVNTNINNPIIGERAFSSNPDEVINASKVVLKEYEKYSIITVGKHFPGHGASDKDSHKTLPVIDIPLNDLEQIHIKPFKEAISSKIPAIMAAHVIYPALDKDNPASVSEKIIKELLIKTLNFKGIIITDDMEMNGIKGFTPFEACTKAINAGVNMFIFRNADKPVFDLVNSIEKAVNDKIIDEELINISVDKILKIKYRYGIIL